MSARNQSEKSMVCYIFFDEGTLSEEKRARLPAPVRLGRPDKNEVVAQRIICCR